MAQGLSVFKPHPALGGDYVGRTWAFFALPDLELDLLAFIKRCIT
jgi:hypothetical protein